MATLPPQMAALTCPNCRTQFQTPVYQLVDAGRQPELKQALIAGRLNVAVCPNCGAGGLLATPLIYHDPAKQIFWALFPQEVQASPEEQEKFIGALQQIVLRSLPADQPKGYLLNPRRFITFNSLLEALLEAEGIPRAAIEAQRKRTELLARLLQADEDEAAFNKIVEEHKADFDYEFFVTLAAYLEASEAENDQDSLERFTRLRDRLLKATGFDQQLAPGDEPGLDEAIDALLNADEARLEETIAEYRPVIDYDFYAALTSRADQARAAGDIATAERIEARRARILETTERMDRQAQELFESAANTLRDVLQAPDLATALRERRDQLGEAFLLVVAANKEAAQRANQPDIVAKLNDIERLTVEVVQESLSPEDRFISQLLNAESPQEATRLLRQNAAMINPDVVKRINELAAETEQNGRKDLADRLRQLGREAASMLF